MLRPYVIVGIDGVLFDPSAREVVDGDWDDYYALSRLDPPFEDAIVLVNGLAALGIKIVAVTERPEKWRQLTTLKLLQHHVHLDEVVHRPDSDFRPQAEAKLRLVEARFGSSLLEQVSLAIESDDKAVAAYRSLGLPVFQAFPKRGIQ